MECFVPAPAMMFRREVAEALRPLGLRLGLDRLADPHPRGRARPDSATCPSRSPPTGSTDGGMFSAMDRISQLEEDLDFYKRLLPRAAASRGS